MNVYVTRLPYVYRVFEGSWQVHPSIREGSHLVRLKEYAWSYKPSVIRVTRIEDSRYGNAVIHTVPAGTIDPGTQHYGNQAKMTEHTKEYMDMYDRASELYRYGGVFLLVHLEPKCMFNEVRQVNGLIANRAGGYASDASVSHAFMKNERGEYETICYMKTQIESYQFLVLADEVKCRYCKSKIKRGHNVNGFMNAQDWG